MLEPEREVVEDQIQRIQASADTKARLTRLQLKLLGILVTAHYENRSLNNRTLAAELYGKEVASRLGTKLLNRTNVAVSGTRAKLEGYNKTHHAGDRIAISIGDKYTLEFTTPKEAPPSGTQQQGAATQALDVRRVQRGDVSVLPARSKTRRIFIAVAALVAVVAAAALVANALGPSAIEITDAPAPSDGGEPIVGTISGTAKRVPRDTHVVIYAYSSAGQWHVQPDTAGHSTAVIDGKWKTPTRGGRVYAALLAKRTWKAPPTLRDLPAPGGEILAVAQR